MAAPQIAQPVVLTRPGLDRLVDVLIADGYLVVGPTVRGSASGRTPPCSRIPRGHPPGSSSCTAAAPALVG